MSSCSFDFSGASVFVTGASGGMGRAITVAFTRAGARVIAADVDASGGDETVALANATGAGSAAFVGCDVSDPDQVDAAVAVAIERHGGLDHAVNAAAIENEMVPLHECSLDTFERMQAVNVRGVFLCMRAELRALLAAGGGTIVNIASTNSVRPQPNQPAYTASKHAVLGLTRSAAVDYAAHGIRVNAILPGGIDTPMLRSALARRGRNPDETAGRLSLTGKFGTPEQIADAALWLSSDASGYTIGHPLAVDAGYLTR